MPSTPWAAYLKNCELWPGWSLFLLLNGRVLRQHEFIHTHPILKDPILQAEWKERQPTLFSKRLDDQSHKFLLCLHKLAVTEVMKLYLSILHLFMDQIGFCSFRTSYLCKFWTLIVLYQSATHNPFLTAPPACTDEVHEQTIWEGLRVEATRSTL